MKEPRTIRKKIQNYVEAKNPEESISYEEMLKIYADLYQYNAELRRLEETGIPENKLEKKIYISKLETLEILVNELLSKCP